MMSADVTMNKAAVIILRRKDYFERNPLAKPIHSDCPTPMTRRAEPTERRKPSLIESKTVSQTLHSYHLNNLYLFLRSKFGAEEAVRLMEDYRVGTSKHWPGFMRILADRY